MRLVLLLFVVVLVCLVVVVVYGGSYSLSVAGKSTSDSVAVCAS